jgi:hypothetical protein
MEKVVSGWRKILPANHADLVNVEQWLLKINQLNEGGNEKFRPLSTNGKQPSRRCVWKAVCCLYSQNKFKKSFAKRIKIIF